MVRNAYQDPNAAESVSRELRAHQELWDIDALCAHPVLRKFFVDLNGWRDENTAAFKRALLKINIQGTRGGRATSPIEWVPYRGHQDQRCGIGLSWDWSVLKIYNLLGSRSSRWTNHYAADDGLWAVGMRSERRWLYHEISLLRAPYSPIARLSLLVC